jgi:hypothetical protein
MQGLLERGLAGTSVWGPESKKGACESLKGPIALAIDILFWVYLEKYLCKLHLDFWILVVHHHSHLHCNRGPQILNFERKSQCVPGAPKQFCSALQNFSSRPCLHDNDKLERKNKINFRTLYVTLYVYIYIYIYTVYFTFIYHSNIKSNWF